MKKTMLTITALIAVQLIFAHAKLPRLFSDNMVLQRDKPIAVWGWADAKEKITVLFNGQTKKITTGKDGKWKLYLDAIPAGGPYQLTVQAKNTIVLKNILVGDVWVCSGQSNMEFALRSCNNAAAEIEAANYPMIRHIEVPKTVASEPKDDITGGEWKVCTPENAGAFTGVGYFFAREVFKETGIPIGLLHSSWGGTDVETWTSKEGFESSDEFKSMIEGLPKLDLDALAKHKWEVLKERITKLQGDAAQADAVIASWKTPSFDDSKWPVMQVPGMWENQSLPDFDGVIWFRKTITVAAADAGKAAVLELAMIDDADETYINGTKVGSTNAYNEKRKYNIPAGILKEGKNVLAVRVLDTGGGGGIYGDVADVVLTTSTTKISLAGEWQYQVAILSSSISASVGPNSYPTLLSNGMINPLVPFTIKGVLWYQGENNAGRAFQYRKAFPLLITDWRKRWGLGDFPFYFVQLATYNANNGDSQHGSNWAELREAQTMTLSLPNTGMSVTTDIGDAKDIHPKNKQDVGKRLAAIALNKDYGKKNEYSGPVYQSMRIDGDKVILTFTHTGSGLMSKNKYGYLQGFEIAGADKKFQYAKAFIKDNTVVVYQEGLSAPMAVRFGWADDDSDNNLFNMEGFPAVPFRTDNWEGITEKAKYGIAK